MKTGTALPFIFLLTVCVSCQNLDIAPETVSMVDETPFTLTATYGQDDTKVALDDDGLGLSWMPGDCLYLVDITGQNSIVKMTTTITEPARKASFKSDVSVLSGTYIVLSNSSNLTFAPYSKLCSNSELQSHIVLYGNLTVTEGQTSASITLSHVFPKLKFNFKNIPDDISDPVFGMAVGGGGIAVDGTVQQTGYTVSDGDGAFVLNLGTNVVSGQSALISPADYSGSKVFFYLYGTAYDGGHLVHVTYEIAKNGVNLQAGNNYNVSLDFSTAVKSTIVDCILNTPADFRAAAYWDRSYEHIYTVGSDIDFLGETVIPLDCGSLDGQNHTLENIIIDYDKCDYVGLVSMGGVENITIRNANVKGQRYVGCATGRGWVENITIRNANVKGHSNVGCATGDGNANKCIVKESTVHGTDSGVGGICGSGYDIKYCGFEGTVTGEGNFVGGIVGDSSIDRGTTHCYSKGSVSGRDFVGGIAGEGSVVNSYFIGDVNGTDRFVAGISGSGICYYSYSYGNVSSGIGISYNYSNFNLTSSPRLYESGGDSGYCNCGPSKTFLSLLSVINWEEAYSTQVWKGIDAQCPLLQWQSDALNGDITIPGYTDVDW